MFTQICPCNIVNIYLFLYTFNAMFLKAIPTVNFLKNSSDYKEKKLCLCDSK